MASTFATSAWSQNLVLNGGFESPAIAPGGFQTIGPGGEPAGFVWSVFSGTVDIINQPVGVFVQFPAFEGNQGLDLNGVNRGTIFQNLATTPGQAYRLSFAYTDNAFEAGISTADIRATDLAGGMTLLSATIAHSTATNGPPPFADYQLYVGEFTATGTTTRLWFESTSLSNSASGGILLDAVSVTPVPEPSSLGLMGIFLAGSIWRRWSARNRPEPGTAGDRRGHRGF